MGAEVA